MGTLLAVPLGILMDKIGVVDSHRSENWFIYIITLIYLKFFCSRRLRVTDYNINSDDAQTCGYLPSKREKELEHPNNLNPQEPYDTDSIEFFGNNSTGDSIGISIVRHSSGRNEIILHLYLSNGKKYVLPQHPSTPLFMDGKNNGVFQGGGLKVICQAPLRRWKISFNGLLRELSSGSDEQNQVVHVKFLFLFSITSTVYDFLTDTSLSLTSKGLIHSNGFLTSKVKKFNEWMNCYEQWGTFRGTVNVENSDERKVFLWGHRTRSTGICDLKTVKRILKIHIYMEDGTMLTICALTIDGLVNCYQYGYINLPTTDVLNITSFVNLCLSDVASDGTIPQCFSFSFHSGERMFIVDTKLFGDIFTTSYGEESETKIVHSMAKFALPNQRGYGIVQLMHRNTEVKNIRICNENLSWLKEIDLSPGYNIPNVVSLKDHLCQSTMISGGKGCSLALLHKLANKHIGFSVPPGIVITTSAYRKYITKNAVVLKALLNLEQLSRKNSDSLKEECIRVSKLIEETPIGNSLKDSIFKTLGEVFKGNLNDIKLAIRSSCQNEDSSETSSAGQMLSILGVSGMDQILNAVLKCWGSQFLYTAVQYKRQNGYAINDSMAVVIQEMVPAEVAGVMFTCDPVTGNPSLTSIAANFGIGESVVSASAEPDTIILQRHLDNEITIKKKILGSKSLKILLSDFEGTLTQHSSEAESSQFCLSDKMVVQLTKIGQIVEEAYGSPRDIEWAIANGNIYLLQSRPVTALDLESEFELVHELDSGLKTEFEYTTRANVGEVYPGTATPLSTLVMTSTDLTISNVIFKGITKKQNRAPLPGILMYQCKQLTLNVIDLCFRINPEVSSKASRDMEVALFGTLLDDEIREQGIHRYGYVSNYLPSFITFGLNAWEMYICNKKNKELIEKYFNDQFPLDKYDSSSALFKEVVKRYADIVKDPSKWHSKNSIMSSICSSAVLGTLQELNGECAEEKLFIQYSKLMSNCSKVLSASVPSGIQILASTIVKSGQKDKFIQMSITDAILWMQNDEGIVGQTYNEFIKEHGHRCIREFDLHDIPWKNNPKSLIESVQNVVKTFNLGTKEIDSSDNNDIINQLEIPSLDFLKRLKLKLLIYLAKQGVRQREISKSTMIKSFDIMRDIFWHMGKLMVSENRLPKAELICFLTYEELETLINTRSVQIVNRAMRRLKMHDKLNSIKLPEIMKGIENPIEPGEPNGLVATDIIKGFPVYPGVVKGVARVITDIKHISEIQNGDILIAYSTDIGWSPYFPLLSGVVTELGGLISHGAIIAREYGLPCLLSAKGCTTLIKSGDFIELDAIHGTLKRIQLT